VTTDHTPSRPLAGGGSAAAWLTHEEQSAWRGLLRMQAQLGAHLNRELTARSGLALPEYAVLVTLAEHPGAELRPSELGKELGWEKSRVSHCVARMQAKGLVERVPCPNDQRGNYVVITRAGHEALDRAAPAHVGDVRAAFVDHLSPAQLATLADISTTVLAVLHQAQRGAAPAASSESSTPGEFGRRV